MRIAEVASAILLIWGFEYVMAIASFPVVFLGREAL
jgi:hypothetical protein